MEAYLELVADCDADCQQRGSQMSLVAILNSTALGIICINALLMLAGTWRHRSRIVSVYCTFFACLFQFCIIVASGVMLFSPYAMFCGSSMVPTAGSGVMWTMADDYSTIVTLWITQIVWMFIFLCIGMCSAMKVGLGRVHNDTP